MTAPLGVRVCPVVGCSRRIHVTDTGTVYARCLAHSLRLLSGAFGSGQGGEPSGAPRPAAFAPLPRVVPAPRPAA